MERRTVSWPVSRNRNTPFVMDRLSQEVQEILGAERINDDSNIADVWEALEEISAKAHDIVTLKRTFWSRVQSTNEPADSYAAAVRLLTARAFREYPGTWSMHYSKQRNQIARVPRSGQSETVAIHISIQHTPHAMLTGRELRLPTYLTLPVMPPDPLLATEFAWKLRHHLGRAHELTRKHLASAHRSQEECYDHKVSGHPVQPGESVFLHQPIPPTGRRTKLHKEWAGSYVVQEVLSETICRLKPAIRASDSTRLLRDNLSVPEVGAEKEVTTADQEEGLESAMDSTCLPGGGDDVLAIVR
ncbi:unnamed protein product [Echinostoma caproni]|uniref:Retrovirus-related Pol polyprotein from type-2 retrotransposable element R2DM n=1 Tax=Echinostoma caproni TaxID=27848 RepID=A0A183BB39_9TREM|nr:unnamed protein product [Echinostoma caproni]